MSNSKISSAAFAYFAVCIVLIACSLVETFTKSPYSFIPWVAHHPWVAKSLFSATLFWLIYVGSLTTGKAFSLKRSANLVLISSLVTIIIFSTIYISRYFIR